MATERPHTVVEGPKGTAEIYEVKKPDGQAAYELRFNGDIKLYMALGEAYFDAGQKVGKKT